MLLVAKIEHKVRPLMAKILPPKIFIGLYSALRSSVIKSFGKINFQTADGNYNETELWGLKFRNDLGNAAGLDKDGSLLDFSYKLGAGFAVVGTVLNKPHTGNLFPFFGKKFNPWVPLPGSNSAINSLGLPSKGIDITIQNILDFKKRVTCENFPIGISIMGHPLQQGEVKLAGIIECVEKSLPVVDFIEINESCPNVKHTQDTSELERRLSAVIEARDKFSDRKVPILVKMGSFGNIQTTIDLLEKLNIDGLIGLNTQTNYPLLSEALPVVDQKLLSYYTDNYKGGVSGPVIKDISFGQITEAAEYVKTKQYKIKLIHVGGLENKSDITTSRDIAQLRQWYSGLMTAISTRPINKIYEEMTR